MTRRNSACASKGSAGGGEKQDGGHGEGRASSATYRRRSWHTL